MQSTVLPFSPLFVQLETLVSFQEHLVVQILSALHGIAAGVLFDSPRRNLVERIELSVLLKRSLFRLTSSSLWGSTSGAGLKLLFAATFSSLVVFSGTLIMSQRLISGVPGTYSLFLVAMGAPWPLTFKAVPSEIEKNY